jgi:hypothetical protein
MDQSSSGNSSSMFVTMIREWFPVNVQLLPDTLVSGLAMMAVIIQSGPIAGLFLAALANLGINAGLQQWMTAAQPTWMDAAEASRCQPASAMSWERVIRSGRGGMADERMVRFPSSYMQTISFFISTFLFAVHEYTPEFKGTRQSTRRLWILYFGMALFALISMVRYRTGCDSAMSLAIGAFVGTIVAAIYVFGAAAVGQRGYLNFFNLPRYKFAGTHDMPLYVCNSQ